MNTKYYKREMIKKLKKEAEENNKRNEQINKEIELINNNPIISVPFQEMLDHIDSDPQYKNDEEAKSKRKVLLKRLIRGISMDKTYNSLFELSNATIKELKKKHGIGEAGVKEAEKFLAEFGLKFKEE